MPAARWLVCALAAALAACGTAPPRDAPSTGTAKGGGGYYQDDGPGDSIPVNLAEVPDAVPRSEPLHRFANRPYEVFSRQYVPFTELRPFEQRGVASWYGRKFHGQKTSSGEPYDMYAMTAAHPTLPIPSYAQVTNLQNGRSVVVRINDRGPFLRDRVIDLSYAGAWKLGYVDAGHARVDVRAIVPGESRVIAVVQPSAGALPSNGSGVAPVSAPAAVASGGLYLQLGAFSAQASAESMRERLQRQLHWVSERIEILTSGALHKLQLGPYRSRDDAIGIADRIAQELNFRPFLVVR
ncbi:MAG TPA: septal ring lytic transglycosylase RlpA family protein [Burkholderiales bacterium]|nr:septal ring lytic transglycosylase RlpA family protein [Burkholderiales bacterium]